MTQPEPASTAGNNQADSAPGNASTQTSGVGLSFLDILFTAAIGFGFSGAGGKGGLAQEDWLTNGNMPVGSDWINLGTLVLGFLTTALSWFGYRRSLTRQTLKYDNPWAMPRFVVDVTIIALYGILILSFKHFSIVIALMCVIFALYAVWSAISMLAREAGHHPRSNLFFCLLFLVIFVMNLAAPSNLPVWIGLSICLTVCYRIDRVTGPINRFFGEQPGSIG
jgi:hypothetical protein